MRRRLLSLVAHRQIINSIDQRLSWEANGFSATQEIPRISHNSKVHYRMYKSLPPVPILSQLNPVHSPHPTSWRTILILYSHLRLSLPSSLFFSGLQAPTHRYFRYLSTGISGTYSPVFQTPTHWYFRYLRIGISGTYVLVFQAPTDWNFRYLRTGI